MSLGDTTIYFRKGQSTTLKCSQRSISPPISWYGPPGLQIYSEGSQTSQRLTHVKITGNQQIGESNLEISMLTNSAEGLYRCSAGFQIEENFTLVLRSEYISSSKLYINFGKQIISNTFGLENVHQML